jgi:hypothetical protein
MNLYESSDDESPSGTVESSDEMRIIFARPSTGRPRGMPLPEYVEDVLDENEMILAEMFALLQRYKSNPLDLIQSERQRLNTLLLESIKALYSSTTNHDRLLETDLVMTNDLDDEFSVENYLNVIKKSIVEIGDGVNPDKKHTYFNEKRTLTLKTIDLSNSENLESIGDSFANNIAELITVNFSSCGQLKTIGKSFLEGCCNLQTISLSDCNNLENIDSRFAYRCVNLKFLIMSNCSKLGIVDREFLYKCVNLKLIDIRGCLTNFLNIDSFSGIRKISRGVDGLQKTYVVIDDLTNKEMIFNLKELFNVEIVNYANIPKFMSKITTLFKDEESDIFLYYPEASNC